MNTVQRRFHRVLIAMLVSGVCWFTVSDIQATLPKPIPAGGNALAVDHETKTLVLKREGKKPVVMDWDEETKFFRDGRQMTSNVLRRNMNVSVLYKRLSFKNPRLEEVRWWTREKQGEP